MVRQGLAAVVLAMWAVSCGGGSTESPAGPSSSAQPAGATITGNVTTGTPVTGLVAQAAGTGVQTAVDAGGNFTLRGVPAGQVRLRFVAAVVDAAVDLPPVAAGDTVTVLVVLSAGTATIEHESRNTGGVVELEGRIESLPPTQPADTLVIGGRVVVTGPQTIIRDDRSTLSFSALAVGQRVHVRGVLQATAIAADLIQLQNTNVSLPVNVNGTVTALSGTAAAFTATVDGREVRGDTMTAFFGAGGQPVGFAQLAVGSRVEVKGLQRNGYVYAERIHINATGTTPQEESASIEGRLQAIGGTQPTLTLTIGTTAVTTSTSTVVQRRGDTQTLAALAVGQTIHAVGTRLADGTLAARLLQIKDDEAGGAFVVSGALGGLKGTCPALSFGVNGFSVTTSAATVFGPGSGVCDSLKSGTKVEVEGTRRADGTVAAVRVTRL